MINHTELLQLLADPCPGSTIADLNMTLFLNTYLPGAIDQETLEKNHRDIKQQLASLRLYDITFDCPTYAGILLLGSAPRFYLPGAYIQYVRFAGVSLESPVLNQMEFSGDINRGIATAKAELVANGNPEPRFEYSMPLHFSVTIFKKRMGVIQSDSRIAQSC